MSTDVSSFKGVYQTAIPSNFPEEVSLIFIEAANEHDIALVATLERFK